MSTNEIVVPVAGERVLRLTVLRDIDGSPMRILLTTGRISEDHLFPIPGTRGVSFPPSVTLSLRDALTELADQLSRGTDTP